MGKFNCESKLCIERAKVVILRMRWKDKQEVPKCKASNPGVRKLYRKYCTKKRQENRNKQYVAPHT